MQRGLACVAAASLLTLGACGRPVGQTERMVGLAPALANVATLGQQPKAEPSPETQSASPLGRGEASTPSMALEVQGQPLALAGPLKWWAIDLEPSNVPAQRVGLRARWGFNAKGELPDELPLGQAAVELQWLSNRGLFPDLDPGLSVVTMGGHVYVGQGEGLPLKEHNLYVPPDKAVRYEVRSEGGVLHGRIWTNDTRGNQEASPVPVRVTFQLQQPPLGFERAPDQPRGLPTHPPGAAMILPTQTLP